MDVGTALLIGLAAGALGSVAFTLVEYLDIAVTRRAPSMVPGEVAVAMLGGDHRVQRDRVKRLNLPTHFMHGTALGVTSAPWKWEGREFAREVVLKAVFAVAVAVAFYALANLV